jgi:Na+-translocating ferredoxin:NAD+ oxidoreductase RNF subunit RnfB
MDNLTIVWYAVGVLGALGAVFGLILAIASKVFAVAVDPRQQAITELLPGANCGGCGYPGCAGYAAAIMNGVPTNKCLPGGDETAAKIAAILGIEAEDVKEMVAFVRCSGGNRALKKYDYSGITDCLSAMNAPGGGPLTCSAGCMGFGTCVKACQFDAIALVDGVAKVDRDACKGCMKCVEACPKGLITMVPLLSDVKIPCFNKDKGAVVRKICPVGCIACKICEKNCPHDAVHVIDNLAVIDPEKCQNCGICVEKCPRNLIISENGATFAKTSAS